MDDAELENKLNELVKEFGEGPDSQRAKLAKLAEQAKAKREQLEESIDSLHELLDYLRVCIKYQSFDVEATRRENAYLRKLLERDDH
jgi:ATP phosphoribosyltransferase regulatory subunit HisZ